MSNFYGVIYLVTNTVNGKQYVGQTAAKNPERYIEGHFSSAKYGRKKYLYAAIRKYGRELFRSEIIWWCTDKSSLDISENSFIELFRTMAPNGYNLRGGGSHGKFSDASKLKLKTSLNSQGYKDKLAIVYADPIIIERKREAMRSVWLRPSHRALLNETNMQPEVIERRKLVAIEAWSSQELRDRQSVSQIARFADPEERRRTAEHSLAQFADPEKRARHKAAYDNDVTRARLREINADLRWVNNGTENQRLKPDEPTPEGWAEGMLYGGTGKMTRAEAQAKGKHIRWHTNRGITNPNCALCAAAGSTEHEGT